MNLYAGARIAEQAAATESLDTTVLVDETGAPIDCTICFESIVNPISLLACGHLFHDACMERQGVSGHRACIVCRAPVRIAPVRTM